YGLDSAYGQTSAALPVGDELDPVAAQATLAGLVPGTTYHVRLVAQNAAGTSRSADLSFTTVPLPAPGLGAATADAVGRTTATLHGSVDPGGLATTWRFEYGPTTAYGSQTPGTRTATAVDPEDVAAQLVGLVPGT